jgi:hypothetical protein
VEIRVFRLTGQRRVVEIHKRRALGSEAEPLGKHLPPSES